MTLQERSSLLPSPRSCHTRLRRPSLPLTPRFPNFSPSFLFFAHTCTGRPTHIHTHTHTQRIISPPPLSLSSSFFLLLGPTAAPLTSKGASQKPRHCRLSRRRHSSSSSCRAGASHTRPARDSPAHPPLLLGRRQTPRRGRGRGPIPYPTSCTCFSSSIKQRLDPQQSSQRRGRPLQPPVPIRIRRAMARHIQVGVATAVTQRPSPHPPIILPPGHCSEPSA